MTPCPFWRKVSFLSVPALSTEIEWFFLNASSNFIFSSFEAGYYPYNLNQDEVIRMTNYFLNLELALQQYESVQVDVDFEKGEMLSLIHI